MRPLFLQALCVHFDLASTKGFMLPMLLDTVCSAAGEGASTPRSSAALSVISTICSLSSPDSTMATDGVTSVPNMLCRKLLVSAVTHCISASSLKQARRYLEADTLTPSATGQLLASLKGLDPQRVFDLVSGASDLPVLQSYLHSMCDGYLSSTERERDGDTKGEVEGERERPLPLIPLMRYICSTCLICGEGQAVDRVLHALAQILYDRGGTLGDTSAPVLSIECEDAETDIEGERDSMCRIDSVKQAHLLLYAILMLNTSLEKGTVDTMTAPAFVSMLKYAEECRDIPDGVLIRLYRDLERDPLAVSDTVPKTLPQTLHLSHALADRVKERCMHLQGSGISLSRNAIETALDMYQTHIAENDITPSVGPPVSLPGDGSTRSDLSHYQRVSGCTYRKEELETILPIQTEQGSTGYVGVPPFHQYACEQLMLSLGRVSKGVEGERETGTLPLSILSVMADTLSCTLSPSLVACASGLVSRCATRCMASESLDTLVPGLSLSKQCLEGLSLSLSRGGEAVDKRVLSEVSVSVLALLARLLEDGTLTERDLMEQTSTNGESERETETVTEESKAISTGSSNHGEVETSGTVSETASPVSGPAPVDTPSVSDSSPAASADVSATHSDKGEREAGSDAGSEEPEATESGESVQDALPTGSSTEAVSENSEDDTIIDTQHEMLVSVVRGVLCVLSSTPSTVNACMSGMVKLARHAMSTSNITNKQGGEREEGQVEWSSIMAAGSGEGTSPSSPTVIESLSLSLSAESLPHLLSLAGVVTRLSGLGTSAILGLLNVSKVVSKRLPVLSLHVLCDIATHGLGELCAPSTQSTTIGDSASDATTTTPGKDGTSGPSRPSRPSSLPLDILGLLKHILSTSAAVSVSTADKTSLVDALVNCGQGVMMVNKGQGWSRVVNMVMSIVTQWVGSETGDDVSPFLGHVYRALVPMGTLVCQATAAEYSALVNRCFGLPRAGIPPSLLLASEEISLPLTHLLSTVSQGMADLVQCPCAPVPFNAAAVPEVSSRSLPTVPLQAPLALCIMLNALVISALRAVNGTSALAVLGQVPGLEMDSETLLVLGQLLLGLRGLPLISMKYRHASRGRDIQRSVDIVQGMASRCKALEESISEREGERERLSLQAGVLQDQCVFIANDIQRQVKQ
ncbi:hypothetical protein KIPB_004083 [Kipferlia bialata]|uniref:SEC7 domain-containing protein n=1 Tax=Kipferlia bialata TaxID=797122 RepID=A0A9K3CWF8_9EUKA|nr:hypothetical protein KIPB_004083 [Kipferlia bialata]|eukprot:g4083.t1